MTMRELTLLAALLVAAPAVVAFAAAEAPVTMTDAQLEQVVAGAPTVPVDLGHSLQLKLIDFIDCTNPDDPHDFKDQGTSRVVDAQAGKYRETAAHRHAFFAYRFRSAGKDKPVLIVFEYPDDQERTINFSTHESGLSGAMNIDWSLETGVYSGGPFPLTGQMRYHTFIMWPQDQWPVAMVGNFHRAGHPAAASRIWVYGIEQPLPPVELMPLPYESQRRLGHFTSMHFLATQLYFGLRSPESIEHMLDYFEYVGVNLLSWTVVHNDSWGFSCTIPAWMPDKSPTHLDDVLDAMDNRGGLGFIAGFAFGERMRLGGKAVADMSPEELRKILIEGFGQFIDRYGRSPSLKGIAIGAQFGSDMMIRLKEKGILADVVASIKKRRPDLQVITYVGGRHLHRQYFDRNVGPSSMTDVIAYWQRIRESWSRYLGNQALSAWKHWGMDPEALRAIEGLTIYEQYQPDDFRIFQTYSQQPRSAVYWDLDASQTRSDHLDTRHAAIWNTHFEGFYGLDPAVNFWYRKHWVAPDFNAPPPYSTYALSRALEHRDRMTLMPGSWNIKTFGWDAAVRRFATAFRTLPPAPMNDMRVRGLDTVKVRWLFHEGKRYIALLSLIPFPATVTVNEEVVELPPYELVVRVDVPEIAKDEANVQRAAMPVVSGEPPEAYTAWVSRRVQRMKTLIKQLQAIEPEAVTEAFELPVSVAERALKGGSPHHAEQWASYGLLNELELRERIIRPVTFRVPRVEAAPAGEGDLDAWPEEAFDHVADTGHQLAGHIFQPNSWSGPEDLSTRVRLCHDGKRLYVGIGVSDSVLARYEDTENRNNKSIQRADSCQIRLSTDDGYRKWLAEPAVAPNIVWSIRLPFDGQPTEGKGDAGFTYTCRPTEGGYVVEGSAPLAELGVEAGKTLGFLLMVADVDRTPNLYAASWAAKQAWLFPNRAMFSYWNDARSCGRLVLLR